MERNSDRDREEDWFSFQRRKNCLLFFPTNTALDKRKTLWKPIIPLSEAAREVWHHPVDRGYGTVV